MKLISRNRKGEVYDTRDTKFKVNKAFLRIGKELIKANFTYEHKRSKSSTIYMIVDDVMVVRISNHTERSFDSDKYDVLNFKEISEGVIILERVNILSNEDMFYFIDYIRKRKK